ncbi:helix-turn-helix transcriptional regulator [Luteibacter aegosomatissinici]|uniref:helix-turn-helix transcriptional regulator n=1 Tax=Luteibacter aegosomatissinici TaxID=2911539 RepID=UPI001FFA3172|nr:AraC family transcriptional regulator [Luteibacter aegosomatissinici]UPG92655.1 AraC family transcriptional regulator [Luteibacter aegosomatissinici]
MQQSLMDVRPKPSARLLGADGKRVMDYIEQHLGERVDITAVAGLLNMSVGHFYRSFKATFGERPGQYITRRRMAYAQYLMLSTDMSLADVALACGMSDQSHFSNVFKRVVGWPPRRWRSERGGTRSAFTPAR